jgi:hypothetical protein
MPANQNVVRPTTIFTVPGKRLFLVKASSISMASLSLSMLSSETSSVSHSCKSHGGEPEDLKIPAAAACVSVGELRAAEGLLGPLELRAMRIWDGFVVILR